MLEPRTLAPRSKTVDAVQWTGEYEPGLREWLAPYDITHGVQGPFWRTMGYVGLLTDAETGTYKNLQRLERGDWLVKDGRGVIVMSGERLNRMFVQVAPTTRRIPPMYAVWLIDPSGKYGVHKPFCEHGETAKDAETSALARYRVPGTALNPDRPTVLISEARIGDRHDTKETS